MKAVAFYVSGHGFGHASREVEIINALGTTLRGLRVVVRSAVNPTLLSRTLSVPYELYPGACDSGVIQSSSIAHDDEATTREAVAFYRTFEERAAEEAAFLAEARVAAVVGDIPPLAFEAAARIGVPSIAIGNFTWDWIYETHEGLTESAPWLLPAIRRAYAKATLALELPFSDGLRAFSDVRKIPLVARRSSQPWRKTRERFGLPVNRPLALLSFGGYGLPALDIRTLDCLDRWTIVTTDRLRPSHGSFELTPHVVLLQEDEFFASGFRYEDLVAASDVVVTKPGYGIIAECIACGPAMLYTSRGQFREYDVLVREMPKLLRCRFIDQGSLFAGSWRAALDALLAQPAPPARLPTDGAERAGGGAR
jgi:hypothetical protein